MPIAQCALIRHYPQDYPEKWELFKKYNARDVETELAIQSKLSRFPVSKTLWDEYHLDQEINDRGIALDMEFIDRAIAMGDKIRNENLEDLGKLTGVDNPNSVAQLSKWLHENHYDIKSLSKKDVSERLKTASEDLKPILELRQQLAKNSIKKYTAMKNAVCGDDRARGMFMFYGANRTGRFAGRIVQLHNLPQNHIPDLDIARALVRSGNYEALQLLYDDLPDTLSQLIRTSFIPLKGKKFIVADFSSIEARVLAWLAREKWRIKTFAEGNDIYCQSASRMFGVPVEKNGINGHLRQKGKIAELALGYGGGVVALENMGALQMGLTEVELQPLVKVWRLANLMITNLWWEIDRAVRETVKTGISRDVNDLRIFCMDRYLFIRLPSGRKLAYVNPGIDLNAFHTELITYQGIKNRGWARLETYGPKLVENIVQGIARDILLFAMQNLRQYKIVAHVHDEIIIEAEPNDSVEEVCQIMGRSPIWAPGLKLKAEGYECSSYRKA